MGIKKFQLLFALLICSGVVLALNKDSLSQNESYGVLQENLDSSEEPIRLSDNGVGCFLQQRERQVYVGDTCATSVQFVHTRTGCYLPTKSSGNVYLGNCTQPLILSDQERTRWIGNVETLDGIVHRVMRELATDGTVLEVVPLRQEASEVNNIER